MNNIVHERFVSNTTVFFNYLRELGWSEVEPVGKGSKMMRVFMLGDNKKITSTFDQAILYEKNIQLDKFEVRYKGVTIGKDLLTFFSQREPIKP